MYLSPFPGPGYPSIGLYGEGSIGINDDTYNDSKTRYRGLGASLGWGGASDTSVSGGDSLKLLHRDKRNLA